MQSVLHYGRRIASFATATALLTLAACSEGTPVDVAPVLPTTPAIPAQYRGAAFIMDVNTLKKSVKITAPTTGIPNRTGASFNLNTGEAQASLLGGDVVDLTATNFVASAVGAFVPGKVRITFDLTVNNKLGGLNLITPTFPTPPSGSTGVQAFPFEISVTTTSGGVGTNGNEIIVTSPRFGAVVPSVDWSGAPHNFFNDVGCLATSNDCFRYEEFSTIGPLGASAAQTVGFDIDPTVGDFRVKLILAADLQSTVTPNPTTVTGTVSSNIGPLNNVAISVSGGFSGNTNASGVYSIANVASGANKTISVSNLPSGCTLSPASVVVTLPAGGTFTQNFTATCAVPVGTISGAITSSLGGAALNGVTVVVTPTGGSALASVTTAGSGNYSRSGVPTIPAAGSITLGNLPSGCTNASPYPYTGMVTGGITVNIVVTCVAAPITYPLSATWGAITNTGPTGRQVTLSFAIDMGAAPGRPDVNGSAADDLAGISFGVAYGAPLDYISRTLTGAGGEFDLGVVNETGQGTAAGQASVAVASTSGQTVTGSQQLIRLTFNIATGFSGTVTPVVNITEALATSSLINVTSSVTALGLPALIVP